MKPTHLRKKLIAASFAVGIGASAPAHAGWFDDAIDWVEGAWEDTVDWVEGAVETVEDTWEDFVNTTETIATWFTGEDDAVGYYPSSDVNPVHSLAQQCFSIQSPVTGKYFRLYYTGGIIDDGMSYKTDALTKDDAARFFFKPTKLGRYMLRDADGRYLAGILAGEMTAGTYAGQFAEFKTTAHEQEDGTYLYRLHLTGLDQVLRNNYSSDKPYYIDPINPGDANSEPYFKLIPNDGCVDYPEIATNVTGDIDALKGDASAPVRGFVDPHTHITSYEFMGGKFMAGAPFSRWGVEDALRDSKDKHGPSGALDIIGNLQGYNDVNFRYDTRGYPDFPFWPNHEQLSHSGYYYKWMERAWLGGQRMIVTHLVENEVLCNLQKTVNPASWINPNSCNTMDSIELQVNRLREMQDYIDAQAGGRGEGFFRLVASPEEAREVIADGKLAVVMGVEASEVLNCGQKDACSYADVQRQVDRLYNWGVRALFPVHKFDNRLGGSVLEDGLMNIGEWLSTGHFFAAEQCDSETEGEYMTSGFPEIGNEPIIGDIVNALVPDTPNYDETTEQCNQLGLTEIGEFLINIMIDKKMLIEMDHMSNKAGTAVLDIAEQRNYSGLISSHGWMPDAKIDGQLHYNMKRLIQMGGFVSPYNSNAYAMDAKISGYLDEVETTPYLNGVGISTDMSGLGGQAGPRYDGETNPLEYPFTTEFGLEIDKQTSGNRTFDISTEGVAHYGLVADHLQDIRVNGTNRVYEAIMNSAEAYLQMWERAEANTSTATYALSQNIRGKDSGMCLNIWGGNAYNGAPIRLHPCSDSYHDDFVYETATGLIRSVLDPNYCIHTKDSPYSGVEVHLWACDAGAANNDFVIYGDTIRPRVDTGLALDAFGSSRGDSVGLWHSHGNGNQQWIITTGLPSITTEIVSDTSGMCMNIWGGEVYNGAELRLHPCSTTIHDDFIYDSVSGMIKSALNPNFCIHLSNSTNAGSTAHIWECVTDHPNNLFDIQDGVITPRVNSNFAIHAWGDHQGADVGISTTNGSSAQQWTLR